MPEGGGENLPRVVSKINDPVEKLNLQRKTADLVAQGVPNDPKQGKDGTPRRGLAESLAIRDMAGKRYIHRQTGKREEAEKLSITDSLTGLPNRRELDLVLTKAVDQAKRTGKSLSVGIVDLDDFSDVNNSLGHAVGDEVLRRVAEILTEQLRGSDFVFKGRADEQRESDPTNDENTNTVSRFGGEEFVITLPEVDGEGALQVGERINWALRTDEEIYKLTGGSITASVGLALTASEGVQFDSPEALLSAADAALYNSKSGGKNRSTLFIPGMVHPPRESLPVINSPK